MSALEDRPTASITRSLINTIGDSDGEFSRFVHQGKITSALKTIDLTRMGLRSLKFTLIENIGSADLLVKDVNGQKYTNLGAFYVPSQLSSSTLKIPANGFALLYNDKPGYRLDWPTFDVNYVTAGAWDDFSNPSFDADHFAYGMVPAVGESFLLDALPGAGLWWRTGTRRMARHPSMAAISAFTPGCYFRVKIPPIPDYWIDTVTGEDSLRDVFAVNDAPVGDSNTGPDDAVPNQWLDGNAPGTSQNYLIVGGAGGISDTFNGIYKKAGGSWASTRNPNILASDYEQGVTFKIKTGGEMYDGVRYACLTKAPIVLGTTPLIFGRLTDFCYPIYWANNANPLTMSFDNLTFLHDTWDFTQPKFSSPTATDIRVTFFGTRTV